MPFQYLRPGPSYQSPPPPPAPKGFLGGVGQAVGHVAQAVQQAVPPQSHAQTQNAAFAAHPGPVYAPKFGPVGDPPGLWSQGDAQVNALKQSASYRQAIVDTFLHQGLHQQGAIVGGALRIPSLEGHTILNYLKSQGTNPRSVLVSAADAEHAKSGGIDLGKGLGDVGGVLKGLLGHGSSPIGQLGYQQQVDKAGGTAVDAAGKGLDTGLKAANTALRAVEPKGSGPAGQVSNLGFGGGTVGQAVVHGGIDTARAFVQDPVGVGAKTAKGLAEATAGIVAAPVQLATHPSQIGKIPGQIASDFSNRYGPAVHGNDQAFIDRIKKQGAAPEFIDALTLGAGLDATAGRALSQIYKTKAKLTGNENFLTRPRPALLLSGSKTRPQQLANTAGRVTAQRLEDKLRAVRAVRPSSELHPGEGQVASIFQGHAMRVVHSAIPAGERRVSQEIVNKEIRHGVDAAVAKLSSLQKLAVSHAVEGVRVDTVANFKADLATRRASIVADRAHPSSLGYGDRIPAQYAAQVDELKLIDKLSANAEKIVGPKMVAFQKGEAARAQRIDAATSLHPATAEARRLRVHGEKLGIQHPDEAAAQATAALGDARLPVSSTSGFKASLKLTRGHGEATVGATKFADYQANRAAHLAKYVEQMRAGMKEHGLPEPGYLKHQEHPKANLGDLVTGTGAKAMSADKQSSWALHRAGVMDRSPEAYSNGLARSIKRPGQWSMTDAQFHAAAYPTPTRDQIKAALGENKAPRDLTGNELRRVDAHRGMNMDKVTYYNPGRLSDATLHEHGLLPKGKLLTDSHEAQINDELHHQLSQSETVHAGSKDPASNPHFLTTTGWKGIPKTAFDEIHGGLRGSSTVGRYWGKFMGTQAGLALGSNPHFLAMNTLAHAVPAIAGTKGAILPDLLKTPFWWHGLTDEQKRQSMRFEAGQMGHSNKTARLGSTAPNAIAGMGRRLDQNGLWRVARSANPFRMVLSAEALQSNFFRHAVMYHEVKRQAFQDMAKEYGQAARTWEEVKHLFSLGPRDRMLGIMGDMPKMEALGRNAINLLGDYGRFTNRERAFFNNKAFLFYSFLRHVTRTLFYVLPARHPLALGLLQELGQWHKNEVQKLLGGQDLPWAYSRVYWGGKNGEKLRSIDMLSTSPVTSSLTDIASGGIQQGGRLMNPAMASVMDMIYGHTPQGAPVQRNTFSFLNSMLSLSYPYRIAKTLHEGLAPQQTDSVPFLHERPQQPKTGAGQAYDAAKQAARGPLDQYLLGTTLGLYPKPDNSQVVAQHLAQKAASKGGGRSGAGGGGWWSSSSSSGSSGGAGGGSAWWH